MKMDDPNQAGQTAPSEALVRKIINGLRRHASIDTTLIPLLHQETGWEWDRCEQFVNQVQYDHAVEISLWQSNMFTIAGYVFIALGVGIALIAVNAYIGFDRLIGCLQQELSATDFTYNECIRDSLLGLEGLYEFGAVALLFIMGGVAGIVFARRQASSAQVLRND
jgi:hypothetical protein